MSKNQYGIGTPIMGITFILIAIITLWDTTSYTDPDSSVFPQTIAIVMIILCIILILQWFIFGHSEKVDFSGNNLRRLGLVFILISSSFLMPWLGFLLTGLIVFFTLTILAMYDQWTPYRLIFYPVSGAAIVVGFYFIFKELLSVPLPVGTLFGG